MGRSPAKMEDPMHSLTPAAARLAARLAPALLGLVLLTGLAACGADGPPEPPSRHAAQGTTAPSGVSISGEGRFGAQTRL